MSITASFSPAFGPRRPDLMAPICRFLQLHPQSSALLVAQHLWQEVGLPHDVHSDSWIWIREQLEQLAQTGVLVRQSDGGTQLWSVASVPRNS